jgi:hypothetical protein
LSCVSSEELDALGFLLSSELDDDVGLLGFDELVVLAVAAFCLDTKADCDAADFGLALGLTVVLITLNPLTKIIIDTIAAGESSGAVR